PPCSAPFLPRPSSELGAVAFTGTNALNFGTGSVTIGSDATATTFTLTNNSALTGSSLTVGGAISQFAGTTASKTLSIGRSGATRSEEHTSEIQSRVDS